MTDSMKFGPEWLRNMSNDMNAAGSGGGGGSSSSNNNNNNSTSGGHSTTTAPLGPRYQLAEYRYGREEMLSLFDKNLKTPEILPTFKTLYVEKVQCPLALTPSTEDEVVNSTRPWGLRSPVSFAVSARGAGRGGSVDRGRGRTRAALYHAIIGYQRPTALYDEDIRGLGRGERSWPERNGGNEVVGNVGSGGGGAGSGGTIDWNGSPSSSPRKEYGGSSIGGSGGGGSIIVHSRSNLENWRRSRTEDDVGDGWRGAIASSSSSGGGGVGTGNSYRWSRSTSWRDEETSNNASSIGGSGSGDQIPSQITRSFSTSAAPTITRTNSSSGSSGFKVTSGGTDDRPSGGKGGSGGGVGVHQWEQDDLLPEWAMENPTDSGGSFDASGAFHGSNEANDEDSEIRCEKGANKSANNDGGDNRKKSKSEISPEIESTTNSSGNKSAPTPRGNDDHQQQQQHQQEKKNDLQHEVGGMLLNHSEENGGEDLIKPPDGGDSSSLLKSNIKITSNISSEGHHQSQVKKPPQQPQPPPIPQQQQQQQSQQPQSLGGVGILLKSHPPPISEISDRMQEVADDMVEKLIMDDEMSMITTTTSTQMPKKTSSSVPSMLKSGSAVTSSNSPTAPTLIQPPLINSHPLISQQQQQQQQPPPPPPTEMWFYRDPQGKVQGPFNATEMAEWYRAGYFDENLYVRRVCDSRFSALGELVKMCGNSMPFLSSHLIPPLIDMSVPPVVPHIPQSNQPPPQGVTLGGKPNVTPILGTSDVMSLNLQLQFLQKQFLMRQQSLILSKLSASEPWSLLNPDQQQQLLNQQMAQVVLPDHLMSLSALSNSLSIMNPSAFALQQMLNTAKNDMNPKKSAPPPLHNPHNPFGSDFVGQSALHSIMQGSVPPQPNMGQQQPPGAPQANGPTLENDPIKSFIMQFHMQGKVPVTGPPMANKWPSNMTPPQAWPGGTNSATGTPVSMWDFGPMAQPKPEMKTEQEILEEQLLKEKATRQQAEMAAASLVGDRTENAPEEVVLQKQQHQLPQQQQQPPPPPLPPSSQQGSHPPHSGMQQQVAQNSNTQQIQPQHQLQQSQQSTSKKEATEKIKQQIIEEKPQKVVKHEEDQKRPKGGKGDNKKENKKTITEEERKKEAIEEKKRLKEERKRQQMEEEKKRQQQQEEEKRRQMLEEKKRLEEIDQHRRAKMLENAPPKPAKTATTTTATAATSSSFERNIAASSVAPWINTGLTGITTPGPNFAEIQKAERERRAEEQRLEQIMESQRKSQMELLAQKENVLMWNAQPLKSVNVKSLAEIQAEEAKRLANDQAAAASLEQRKKEEAVAAAAAAASLPSSSYGNNAFGSIWNSRSAQNMVWNGKTAWSTTSTSGFWEEPTKQSTSASAAKQAANSRSLSKSQTISNIQTVKKENTTVNKQVQQNSAPVSACKTAKGGKKKETPAASASASSSSNTQTNSSAKKDDARNEFTSWCIKTLSSMNSTVDVPIFISFLQDIESPFEVKDYIRVYLGETKECTEFAKQFLERRSKYKNQQRAQNAHIDDMCSPAPAINPASDFQEVKGKGKKVKKNKMTKLDARILGFSVTAAQDRINVGDRDYGDAS